MYMPIPDPNENIICPTDNDEPPATPPLSYNPPFNKTPDDLDKNHKKDGWKQDPVSSDSASPPISTSYTVVTDISGISDPFLQPQFSIYIYWEDPSSSEQGIEIQREDLQFSFKKSAPSGTTTKGWFVTDPALGSLNPIVNNLDWGKDYRFKLRTSYQFVGDGSIFSEWVYLSVFQRNEEIRRKNDKCAVETLEAMEVRLSQNFAAIPKAYRYSKIVKGGSRQVVCQTWRPQGWKSGAFLKEDYPITVKVEEERMEKAKQNAGRALCGGEPCIPGDTGTESTKISSYTGGLIFGTAALNFKENMTTSSIQIYPCGKALRRTGGKLPLN